MPTALIGGQSVCTVTGLELTLCDLVSLLTKVTLLPAGMRTSVGVTPVAENVIVAEPVDGAVGDSSPQEALSSAPASPTANAADVRRVARAGMNRPLRRPNLTRKCTALPKTSDRDSIWFSFLRIEPQSDRVMRPASSPRACRRRIRLRRCERSEWGRVKTTTISVARRGRQVREDGELLVARARGALCYLPGDLLTAGIAFVAFAHPA